MNGIARRASGHFSTALSVLGAALVVTLGAAHADENDKTLTRDVEEVVVKGIDVSAWRGQETDRIHLYRWNGSGFEPIPFQVDHVARVDLDAKCYWYDWGGANLCEYNYDFDASGNENVSSTSTLTDLDQIVFLARDSGSRAPNTNQWELGNVDTMRYEIEVQDRRSDPPKKGWVYGYLWLEEHAPETPAEYYVRWTQGTGHAQPTRDEDATCDVKVSDSAPRKSRACGLFEGLQTNFPSGTETYNLNFKGNWIINRLQLRPFGASAATDVLDRSKYRGTGAGNNETEHDWCVAMCGLHHGDKTGRVRTIYVGQGSQSGIGTTVTYWLYPTHYHTRVRLRVHNNVTHIKRFSDYLGGMPTPAQIYVSSKRGGSPPAPILADTINGIAPTSSFGQPYEEWTQVNTGYGRLVEFFRESRRMPVPQQYYYSDSGGSTLIPEFNSGAYGNHGQEWADPTPWMQDTVCLLDPDDPSLLFAQLDTTVFFASGGVGAPGANEADEFKTWIDSPLTTVQRIQYFTIPIPPPPPVPTCPPALSVEYGNDGRDLEASPSVPVSGCTETGSVAGFRVYRALGMGAFKFAGLVALGGKFRDVSIYREQTYRYQARTINADGREGPVSMTVAVLTRDTEAPDAPLNPTATPLNESVGLGWVAPHTWDLRGCNIYVATTAGGPYVRANPSLITGTEEYTVPSLQNSTTYYFVVRSVDWGNNESANSAEVFATPLP